MAGTIQNIYCDESGFTGNNLLHPDQPVFVYAAVAVDEEEAKEITSRIIKDYHVQGNELKGSKLTRYNKGRKAITDIFKLLERKAKASIFNKKYALCCNFYEIIFEPLISEINSTLYMIGFQKFISNILYMELEANRKGAKEILEEFENLARYKNLDRLHHLFGSIELPSIDPILHNIKTFTFHNKDKIFKHIDVYQNFEYGKWLLDLTDASLLPLLADWGQNFEQINVFCDNSKPLNSSRSLYDSMIGRTNKATSYPIEGKTQPLTFNLYDEIHLVDSTHHPGIQLADVIASGFAYAFTKGQNDKDSQGWCEHSSTMVESGFVVPDKKVIDINSLHAKKNAIVFEEFVQRSINRKNLVENMPAYIKNVNQTLFS